MHIVEDARSALVTIMSYRPKDMTVLIVMCCGIVLYDKTFSSEANGGYKVKCVFGLHRLLQETCAQFSTQLR